MHRKVIKVPQMLTAKYSGVKHISEEISIWVGIWVILNHLACFWGWAVIVWEPIPIACGELGWLWKCAGAVLSHATAALKLKPAVLATCRDLWSLPLNAEGCSNPSAPRTRAQNERRIVHYWVLYREGWPGEGLHALNLWEQLLGRWVKAWGEIMLLGVFCSSWEGQMAFPPLGAGADHPEPPHCSASALWGAGFWGGDSAQHLPKGGIHGFNFVGNHPL